MPGCEFIQTVKNSIGSFSGKARICALIALVALCAAPLAAQSTSTVATVTVNTQKLGATIPKGFLGFSNEVSTAGMGLPTPTQKALGIVQRPADVPAGAHLAFVLGEPGAPNRDFFTFMRNLGPGLMRLGGNSQDNTCWDMKAAPHPDWCKGPITPGLLKLYSTAVGAAGWQMIIGLNLKQNSPKWALSEVTDGIAKEIPSDQIFGLELGNEPSLFARTPARPGDYSPQDYVKDALGYIHALQSNPVAKQYAFVAPANCCGWENPRALGTILDGIGSDLKLVSIHNYTTTTCGHQNVTAAELLSPRRMQSFDERMDRLSAVAHRHNLPIALAETNSASCGGMAGVSDAFASTVWGLDYMFNVARAGYTSINFHFSYRTGGSAYNPVQTFEWKSGGKTHYRNLAEPLYYAMYAFAKYASGEHFLDASIKTDANITAFATSECASCAIHVFVINKDESASGKVALQVSGSSREASLVLLDAPSLASLANDVHLGGSQFDTRGRIQSPHTTKIKRGADGDFSFTLPNASAAILTLKR